MITPEKTQELMEKYSKPLAVLVLPKKDDEWNKRHPVTAQRVYDLTNALPTQPEDRQRRILRLIDRLYSRR